MKLKQILTEMSFTTWVNFPNQTEKRKGLKQLKQLGFYIAREDGNSLYVQGDDLKMKDIFFQKDKRLFKYSSIGPKA